MGPEYGRFWKEKWSYAEAVPQEFRLRALDLADRWLKPGTAQVEFAELAAARQKIRDLEKENEILRRAAATSHTV